MSVMSIMRIQRSLFVLLVLCAPGVRADATQTRDPPKPMDFASGIELTVQPGLAVQTLLLPLAAYRGARPDLSDLSVFDADGHPVAWALRTLAPVSEVQRQERSVPFFPLHGAESARASGLALRIARSADGTIINVQSPDADAGAVKPGKLLAYIVHLGGLSEPVTGLRFELEVLPARGAAPFDASEASALVSIQVEASDDLSEWQPLASGETIGRLLHGGQQVERTRVGFAPTRCAFLRVTWRGDLPFAVSKIQAEHERIRSEQQLAYETITLGPAPLEDGAYALDLGGSLALHAIAPRLLAQDVLLKTSLLAGDAFPPRHQVFAGQLYHLAHAASALNSQPIALFGLRARFLSLRVDARASQPPKDPLLFDVSYAPEQLLFVAHGPKAHLLAFGSYRSEPSSFSGEQLLAFLSPAQRADLPMQSVRAGPTRTLAGPAARKPPLPPHSYRVALLWGVLLLGAATLIFLALRLLQKTRAA